MPEFYVKNVSKIGRAVDRANYIFPADGKEYLVDIPTFRVGEVKSHRDLIVRPADGSEPAPVVEDESDENEEDEISEETDQDSYDDWSVDDLRDECENRGLAKSGSKGDLVARLEQDDEDDEG